MARDEEQKGLEQLVDLETVIRRHVVAKDPRYAPAAYCFLYEALTYAQKLFDKRVDSEDEAERHVTGQELLEGVRRYALEQFGPLAPTVFRAWGLKRSEDFGEMVFNLVEAGLMAKTDSDSLSDFADGFRFDEDFENPL